MNFSIFSSNKNQIKIFIATFFILVIGMDVSLYLYIDRKTTSKRYVDELSSKTKHMLLNKKSNGTIFIGSSRTFYQIDSEYFKKNDIDAYNYGISGRHLANYSYMVDNAIKTKPTCIVIGMDMEKLYNPLIGTIDFPTLSDIWAFMQTSQGIDVISKAIFVYLKNLHLLNTYDTVIYEKLKAMIDKLHSAKKDIGISTNGIEKNELEEDFKRACDYFEVTYNRGAKKHETLLKCKNGDGIIYGNVVEDVNKTELSIIDEKHFQLLRYNLEKIHNNNIKSILIFMPKYSNPFIYKNMAKLKNRLNADKIIDMTDVSIPQELWGDSFHLNYQGRGWYSNYIYNEIEHICK